MVFKKGHKPWNKDTKGLMKSNSTSFKKGHKPWHYGTVGVKPSAVKGKNNEKVFAEKNGNWKGGITSENRKLRASTKWIDWRAQVFERDNYTCQSCNVKGIPLEPHHMYSFAKYPEYRFEEWNGQTLCKQCHKDLHDSLGRGN